VRSMKEEFVQSSVEDVYAEGELEAEEKLRKSEEKFRSIFENASDCMIYLDGSGRVLEVNRKAVEVFGGSREELLGKHFTRVGVLSPKDIPALLSAFANGLRGKHPALNLRIKNKKGQEIYLECSGSLTKIDDRLTVLVIARDVTERKRMEEALRESEEKYRSMIELAPDIIVTADLKGAITSLNTAGERISGYSRDEVVGKHFLKIGHIKLMEWPKYLKMLNSVVRGKVPEPFEVSFIHKDGTPRLVEVRASLLKQNGKPKSALAIMRDATERKKVEETLRESEQRYRELAESISDVFFAMDKDLRYTYWNKASEKLTGISAKDAIGKSLTEVFPDVKESKIEQFYLDVLGTKQSKSLETEFYIGGKEFVFEINAYPTSEGLSVFVKDITEHKKMEETLRKSENKSRTLLENLPQKIFFKDKNSVYISCNENYARDLKIHPDEIAGKTDYAFYPKTLAEKYRADDKRIMEYGKTEDIEEEYIQDGQKVFVHTVKTPVKDENGNIVGILGIFWDINEQKRAEEALRESEEKYRVLVESAADAIFTLDEAGNFLSANLEAAKAMGKTLEEMIGKNMYDLFPKGIADLQMRKVKAVFQTGNPLLADETLTQTKLGLRWYNTTLMPVRDSNGKIIYTIAISRDTTERKKMEEKLKQYSEHLEELVQKRTEELLESEKRYSVLVEEAGDGVIILQDGKIVFTNKRAAETIRYSKDEMMGLSLEKLVDEGSLLLAKEMYERNLRGETPTTFEVKWIAKTGERIPFEVSGARIHYHGRPAVLRVARDIRERKRMEEERLRLEKLATVGELATMVGHDLRNPLQSIENAAYYLKNELANLSTSVQISPKTKEMLQVLNDSINYADKIIKDLQDFSSTKPSTLEKADINMIVKEALSIVKTPTNIEIRTELDYLPQIRADKDQMKRVFLNLTTNAIQAMEKGGTLTVSTRKNEGFFEVSFKDTGVGISEESMKKIFTPFFTTRAKGMGMGLSICKKFIEMHGGSIHVESEVGKGTTFTVKLPISQDNGGEKT